MKTLGIERSVISLATPLVNYHVDAKLAVEAARLCNDGFAQLIASPGRFQPGRFCLCRIPRRLRANCVGACATTDSSAATSRAMYVVAICPIRFRPVFDAAESLMCHFSFIPLTRRKDRTADYELTVVAGYLFDTTINIMRMICSNFLDAIKALNCVRPYRCL